ncbi:MobV family relaxase [Metabacillus fastidiosus]|uniref:MobV family relaxase n=1 Tax=Metabacillus fastidiosus TaxID=1458 RepID=UPI002E1E715F|nr:MobV family relaxase [Metabacillus fastidiosus]MED4534861.1 MobV family relaxase [Metabacillus fastidiosus]
MSYAVVRMIKMKSHDLKGIQFHNQRERESRTNPDIDETKTNENYDLINEQQIQYNERVKEIIEQQKTGTRKTRKDAVLVNEFIVTSDRAFFEGLTPGEERRFFEESVQFFGERYGAQNVPYAVVHKDEHTPHMHLGIVPMKDGRLQGKNVFNRQELLWLQEEYPKHMQSVGFDVMRGEQGSERAHLTTTEFKLEKTKEKLGELENETALLEKSLSHKKSEMSALSAVVPEELKIKAKKETKTEVVKKGLFSSETVKKETGNLVIAHEEYKKMREVVTAASAIKKDYERLQKTDLVQENKQLREENKELSEAVDRLYEDWKDVSAENRKLKNELGYFKERISDLKLEIQNIYKSTKEFLKERTDGLKAFKSVFKGLVDKVKEKKTGSEFEQLYKREQARERSREFER